MSERNKRYDYKENAEKAYAYYKKYGAFGALQNGWDWLLKKPERLTGLSTFAIFLATAVAVGVGIAQWRALHSTDEKIGRQLTLMEADQRPWVGVETINDVLQRDVRMFVVVNWKNTGRAPALEARSFVRLKSTGKGEDGPAIPSAKDNRGEPGMLIPGALSPSPLSDTPIMNQPTLDAIGNGDLVLWVVGRIDYSDPAGKPHHTAFQAQYSPVAKIWQFIRSEAD